MNIQVYKQETNMNNNKRREHSKGVMARMTATPPPPYPVSRHYKCRHKKGKFSDRKRGIAIPIVGYREQEYAHTHTYTRTQPREKTPFTSQKTDKVQNSTVESVLLGTIGRDTGAGGGGGAVGATCPHNLEAVGRRPPTLDCQSHSFLFLFVFARELGSLPKNSGPNPGSF